MKCKRVVSLLLAAMLLVVSPVSALASETESCEAGDFAEAEIIEEEPEVVEEQIVEEEPEVIEEQIVEEEPEVIEEEIIDEEPVEEESEAEDVVIEESAEIIESGSITYGDGWEYDSSTATLTLLREGVYYPLAYDEDNPDTTVKHVIVKDGVETLKIFGYFASVETVSLPDSVKTINPFVFYEFKKLQSINIPNGVTSIGSCAFEECESLTSIVIPDSVTELGGNIFKWCTGLKNVTLPSGIKEIPDGTFFGCKSLVTVTIPEGVTRIGWSAFSSCDGLKSMDIPDSVTSIGEYAFEFCKNIKVMNVGNGLETLEDGAFSHLYELESLILPEGLKTMGVQAIRDCKSITSITIPKSVTSIGEDNLYNCDNLTYIDNKSACSIDVSELMYKKYTATHYKWYKGVNGNSAISKIANGVAVREDYKGRTPSVAKGYYRVKFNGNKATSGSMNFKDYKLNKSYRLPANAFKRTGYTFAGWSTSKTGKGQIYKNKAPVKNLISKSKGSVTLYAQWKANTYTVKFKSNGGKGTTKSVKCTYGKTKTLSANKFKKKGYKFKGWATSASNAKKGIVKYKNKAKVKNLSKKNKGVVTLYAVWGK